MCDFGISGYLVDSVAKTIDAGCKRKTNPLLNFDNWMQLIECLFSCFIAYMAPERIDPTGKFECIVTFDSNAGN